MVFVIVNSAVSIVVSRVCALAQLEDIAGVMDSLTEEDAVRERREVFIYINIYRLFV